MVNHRFEVIPNDVIASWPFGHEFAQRFATWWHQLTWSRDGVISSLELYIDYALFTKSLVPVCIAKKTWALREHSIVADESSLALNLQSRTWTQILQWFLSRISFPIDVQKRGRGLHHAGYTIPVNDFSGRPILTAGIQPSNILWNYFHRAGTVVRDMKAAWNIHMYLHE